jgi:hypothetical protein
MAVSKVKTTEGYLEELQRSLSQDSYLKFKASMCGYSKVRGLRGGASPAYCRSICCGGRELGRER